MITSVVFFGERALAIVGSSEFAAPDDERLIEAPALFEVLDSFVGDDGEKLEGFPSMRMVFTFETTDAGSRLTNTTYFT